MGKRGREHNRRRKQARQARARLLPGQAVVVRLTEDHIAEALEDPLRLFILSERDEVVPIGEAMPQYMGLMIVGCLEGTPRQVVTPTETFVFAARLEDGFVVVEWVGQDRHIPLLLAPPLADNMRSQLAARALEANVAFMSE